MIQDKLLEFMNNEAVTVTAISHIVDQGPKLAQGWASGVLDDIPIEGQVTEAFDAVGAATLVVSVSSSDNSDGSSPTVHQASPAIGKAALTLNANLRDLTGDLRWPARSKRYVFIAFTVATGPMTAGKLTIRGGGGRQMN